MKIYLIYEEHYDQNIEYYDNVTVYPYKNYEDVIKRLSVETGLSAIEVLKQLKETNSITTANFYYRIEESELQ